MDNEKIYELLEKIYVELQDTKTELQDTKKEVRQIGIKVDCIDDKLKQMSEVQVSHYEENQRNHKEMIEILSERVQIVENVIRNSNIKAVK